MLLLVVCVCDQHLITHICLRMGFLPSVKNCSLSGFVVGPPPQLFSSPLVVKNCFVSEPNDPSPNTISHSPPPPRQLFSSPPVVKNHSFLNQMIPLRMQVRICGRSTAQTFARLLRTPRPPGDENRPAHIVTNLFSVKEF